MLHAARLSCALIALLLVARPAAAQEVVAPAPAPTLVAEPALIDFGDLFDGEPARSSVVFRNAGQTDWAVQQVKTTCGCTLATLHGPDGVQLPALPTQPGVPVVTLKPGESMSVGVELVTANAHGQVEKYVQVWPMDASGMMVQVPVRGRVSKAFAISPEHVNLEKIGKTGRVEHTLVLQSQLVDAWTIDGFESALEGQDLPPGLSFEVLDTEGVARRVQLVFEGPRAVGPVTARVRMRLGHERVKSVEFYVYGIVESDVVFDSGNPTLPESISFDQMPPDSKVTRTLKITNRDPATPYVVSAVEMQVPPTQTEFFRTELREVEPGVRYEIDVTADAKVNQSFFRGNLVLVADHPDVPRKVVTFHGWVRRN